MTDPDLLAEAADPATSGARLRELSALDRGLWPALAANPSTYPGLLAWLDEHGDDTVRTAIAGRTAVLPPPPPAATSGGALPGPPTASAPDGSAAKSGSRRVALVVAAVVLVLAAVGGGAWALAGGGDDGGDNEVTLTDRPAEPEASDEDVSPGGDGDDAEFCSTLEQFGLSGDVSAMPGSDDYDEIVDGFRELADVAPAEIAAEMQTIAEFMEYSANLDYESMDPEDFDLDELDMEGYFDALTTMSEYSAEHCY